jgi:MoxR-like ATPase
MTQLSQKFLDIETEMNLRLIERTKEVRTAITALASRTHVLYVGPPGTAKTATARLLSDLIDFNADPNAYFEILMTRFSNPEEIFGPVSVTGLAQDVYLRQTDGYLPTARIVFLDEAFKANSSILNAQLWALNERKYRHGSQIVDIPLLSAFCASNEFPQGEELEALYDRIPFRHVIKPIQEPGSFVNMLKLKSGPVTPIVTIDEVLQAQAEVDAVVIPDDVLEGLYNLRAALAREGIEPSDRRFMEARKIIRASAWLAGRTTAELEDTRLLRHVFWSSMDEIATVEKTVLELVNPLDREAADLLEQINSLRAEFDNNLRTADSKQELRKAGLAINDKLNRAKNEVADLEKKQQKSGRSSDLMGELNSRMKKLAMDLMKDVFDVDVA